MKPGTLTNIYLVQKGVNFVNKSLLTKGPVIAYACRCKDGSGDVSSPPLYLPPRCGVSSSVRAQATPPSDSVIDGQIWRSLLMRRDACVRRQPVYDNIFGFFYGGVGPSMLGDVDKPMEGRWRVL